MYLIRQLKGKELTKNELLIYSVFEGNLSEIKKAIEDGADVNFLFKEFMTPLNCACFMGYYEIADFLIKSGADVNLEVNPPDTDDSYMFLYKGTPFEACFMSIINCYKTEMLNSFIKIIKILSEKISVFTAKKMIDMVENMNEQMKHYQPGFGFPFDRETWNPIYETLIDLLKKKFMKLSGTPISSSGTPISSTGI